MALAYLLAIGSAIVYGAGDFTGGLATRRARILPVVLISQASGLLLLAVLLPILPPAAPSRADLLWGVAAGVTGGIGVALLYLALAIGTMSVVAPTTAVCAVAIPVMVSLGLGERPAPIALAGIALGIGSIILVSKHNPAPSVATRKPERRVTGVGTAMVSGVAIGLFLLTFAQTRSEAGMWPLLVARMVSVSIFVVATLTRKESLRMPVAIFWLTVFCGFLDMLANALYLLATRSGPLSIVVTLTSLYPASTVLLARVVLSERLSRWQVAGVGCALVAIVLIVSG